MTDEEKEKKGEVQSKKETDLFEFSMAVNHLMQDREEGAEFSKEDRQWIRDNLRCLLWLLEE